MILDIMLGADQDVIVEIFQIDHFMGEIKLLKLKIIEKRPKIEGISIFCYLNMTTVNETPVYEITFKLRKVTTKS